MAGITDATDRAFYQARIDATEASIVAFETALDEFASGAQSYTIDTGQTRQTVSKANITELRKHLDALYNRRATLKARLDGAASIGRGAY